MLSSSEYIQCEQLTDITRIKRDISLDWADNMKAQQGAAICHIGQSQFQIKIDDLCTGSRRADIKLTP